MDPKKALSIVRAALELHAGHMNGTVPVNDVTQARLMTLLEEAYKALGGVGGPGGH